MYVLLVMIVTFTILVISNDNKEIEMLYIEKGYCRVTNGYKATWLPCKNLETPNIKNNKMTKEKNEKS